MRLDPATVKTMTLSEFHAYAAGFSSRHGADQADDVSEEEFLLALSREHKG